jgi:lycopene beta-cyclase
MTRRSDVVVVGSGPAGWAMAHACSSAGLATVVVAPRPDAAWVPTYGLWADQLVALPAGAASSGPVTAWAAGRRLARSYAILDNASVQAAFGAVRVERVADVVTGARLDRDGVMVTLRHGEPLTGRVVVDASGHRRVLTGGPVHGPRAEQTAYGLVLPASVAAPLVSPGEAVFMSWGRGEGWPTFLYAVPLPGGRTLLEETSLARRPGLPLEVLRARLHARLAAAGIDPADAIGDERVRFTVDLPAPRPSPGVVGFGVAGALMHPATGYSVGDAFLTAPAVAEALAATLDHGPETAARAARAVVRPPAARAVDALRRWGLHTLLGMRADRVPAFFDAFFDLSPDLQLAYLSGRTDLPGTARAMAALFGGASWGVRGAMLAAQVSAAGVGGASDSPPPAAGASTPGC